MKEQLFACTLVVFLGGQVLAEEPPDSQPAQPSAAEIDPEVYTKLQSSDDGTVHVTIKLKHAPQENATPQQQKAAIKTVQDEVLAKMPAEAFDLVYRFETAALLNARISAASLTQLATNADVVAVAPSKIEAPVFAKLQDSEDGMVHVVVNLTAVTQGTPTSAQRKALVKQVQDRVLVRLKPGEFKVEWRFEFSGGFSGHVSEPGLAKMAVDTDVRGMGLDIHATFQLDTSILFMRADQVHDLGYTGAGVTIPLLDSGVDRTHAELQGRRADGVASPIVQPPKSAASKPREPIHRRWCRRTCRNPLYIGHLHLRMLIDPQERIQ